MNKSAFVSKVRTVQDVVTWFTILYMDNTYTHTQSSIPMHQ
jgi:hypothetical protein